LPLAVLLVQPPDVDHVRDFGDVPAPIALLLLGTKELVLLKDWLDVLDVLDSKVFARCCRAGVDVATSPIRPSAP
jgi:hypothetical protein